MLHAGMQEEMQEKICAMLRHATSSSGADIEVEDALGLAWIGLALSHEASILQGGSSELKSSIASALVEAVMEVCPVEAWNQMPAHTFCAVACSSV